MTLSDIKRYFKESGLNFVRLMDGSEVVVPWPSPTVTVEKRWAEIEAYVKSPVVDLTGLVIEGKLASRSQAIQRFPLEPKKTNSNGVKNTPPEGGKTLELLIKLSERLTHLETRLEQLENEFAEAIEEAASLDEAEEKPSIVETVLIPTGLQFLDRYLTLQENKQSKEKPTQNDEKDSEL